MVGKGEHCWAEGPVLLMTLRRVETCHRSSCPLGGVPDAEDEEDRRERDEAAEADAGRRGGVQRSQDQTGRRSAGGVRGQGGWVFWVL